MAKGNEIVVSANPRGVFLEGIVSGTPKPGTVMQLKASTEPVQGRHTWEVYNRTGLGAGGAPSLVVILLADQLQGKTYDDAYADGDRCFLYCPLPGEEVNMRIANIAGTADDYAIGDMLQVVDGSGLLQDAMTGTAHNLLQPFMLMETITDPTAEYMAHVMATGC